MVLKKFLSVAIALLVLTSSVFVCYADESTNGDSALTNESYIASENDYTDYINEYKGYSSDVSEVEVDLNLVFGDEEAEFEMLDTFESKDGVLKWTNGKGGLTFKFTSPKNGLYNILIDYRAITESTEAIEFAVLVDGKEPFKGANSISLPRIYADDENGVRKDGIGNEFAAEQKEVFDWQKNRFSDSEGLNSKPYLFALSEGEHTITIYNCNAPLAIGDLKLCGEEKVASYSEVLKQYKKEGYKKYNGNQINIQGEDAYLKSAYNLIAQSDSTSASVYPYHPIKSKVNYIGGNNWSGAGDKITWKIKVPENALYSLTFSYQQSYLVNGNSYRVLRVDDEIPFAEAAEVGFGYTNSWDCFKFADKNGDPYLIYLTEGEHEISLEVNLGSLSNFAIALKNQIYELGTIYREIVMITGETPDANRDYALFNQIPDLEKRLKNSRKILDDLVKEAESLSEDGGSASTSTLKNMSAVITRMLDYKYQAQIYKSSFYDNYSSISAWLYEIISMPLDIDAIYVTAPEKEAEHLGADFWERLWFAIKRFFASFVADYNSISGDVGDNKITLWVNWGRDQVQVLNYLAQSDFTVKTGIGVDIKMTNATIIQGMLSGNGPDCYLHMSRTEPVNLAMRGALYDLSKFEDFDEVVNNRFINETATVPYQYNGGTYALPDTQTFSLMFYRKDILAELGIEVTNDWTWDDFIAASAVIMRNNMQVGLPYVQITDMNMVNQGLGALNIFPTLLEQRGISLYDEKLESIDLTSENTVSVFTMWTDLYNKYSFPKTFDFYNRFRTGTMPLAIQSVGQYNTISAAASEIRGLWGIAPIPGFKDENGNVNHSQVGAGSACAILKDSKNIKGAWEFIKWWTSEEVQLKYSQNIEAILGPTARNMSSNPNALAKLSWGDDDFEIILEQWKLVHELPEVPGGYYIPRVIDQAFWNVIGNGKGIEEELIKWDKAADKEIAEKRSQYQ